MRRDRRVPGPLLAETVVVEPAVEHIEQVGPSVPELLVDGERADEAADAARLGAADAQERQHVGRIGVGCQLVAVAVGAGVGVAVGDIGDLTQPLPHHALRHRPAEVEADPPEHDLELRRGQPVHRKAPHENHATALEQVAAHEVERRAEGPDVDLVLGHRLGRSTVGGQLSGRLLQRRHGAGQEIHRELADAVDIGRAPQPGLRDLGHARILVAARQSDNP